LERKSYAKDEPFACDVLDIFGRSVPYMLCFARALLFCRDPFDLIGRWKRGKREAF
jgi:hypothetical protein